MKANNTTENLCDSCSLNIIDCPINKHDIVFGDGIGNDNVIECQVYEPEAKEEKY